MVTGARATNEYNKEVGDQQVTIKSLQVKVQSAELFGLKSDDEPAPAGEPDMTEVEQPAKGSKK